MIIPELLIPAGTEQKLHVALEYGADAVYVGAAGFSMRPDGASFSIDQLRSSVALTHQYGKRLYVGVNSLIMQSELPALKQWLEETRDIAFDALIVADPATFMLTRQLRPDVEIHISTQMSTANALAAQFWKDAGAQRIILARECSLAETRQITEQDTLPVEIFVHGAMCVAVSGRCLLSAYMTGFNASKGQCKHSCHWQWEVKEAKRPGESYPVVEADNKTIIFSSTDLCLLEHIPALVQSGVASLKVEGRMKSEYYIASITRSYRAALDAYAADPDNYTLKQDWLDDVNSVRHHPYATGFAFGYPTENPAALQASYVDIGTKDYVGIIESINDDSTLVQVKHPFDVGEKLEWIGPQSKGGFVTIGSILDKQNHYVKKAHPGTSVHITIEGDNPLSRFSILRRNKTTDNTQLERV